MYGVPPCSMKGSPLMHGGTSLMHGGTLLVYYGIGDPLWTDTQTENITFPHTMYKRLLLPLEFVNVRYILKITKKLTCGNEQHGLTRQSSCVTARGGAGLGLGLGGHPAPALAPYPGLGPGPHRTSQPYLPLDLAPDHAPPPNVNRQTK